MLLPIQKHLLIRSDRARTSFKGVHQHKDRYKAECNRSPCRLNYLGTFDAPEEAAQAYLQHLQQCHSQAYLQHLSNVQKTPPVSPPLRTGLRSGQDSDKTESCGPGPSLQYRGSSIAVRSILTN